MKKIEALDNFNKVNESTLTNEELLDFVHKLGYNSIDDIKKEKSKLAKLEALFSELNMDNGQPAKKVDEDDVPPAEEEKTDDTQTTEGDEAATEPEGDEAATEPEGDDAATEPEAEDSAENTEEKPKSMHIKSFAEFCGEVEEDKEPKTNSDTMNESEIKSDEQFKEYAMNILKKAHPDDFDEEVANKTIEGILKDHNGDYGAAIGALNHGLSK